MSCHDVLAYSVCKQRVFSGGSMLGPEGHKPPRLLIGSVLISLSRCCLPNVEGPGPQIFFPRTATACVSGT